MWIHPSSIFLSHKEIIKETAKDLEDKHYPRCNPAQLAQLPRWPNACLSSPLA